VILHIKRIALEGQHHTLQAALCRGQRFLENSFKRLVVSVDSHIRLAKEKLIKLVKTMDNCKCFSLDLRITLFSWGERAGAESDRLPLNISSVREESSRMK